MCHQHTKETRQNEHILSMSNSSCWWVWSLHLTIASFLDRPCCPSTMTEITFKYVAFNPKHKITNGVCVIQWKQKTSSLILKAAPKNKSRQARKGINNQTLESLPQQPMGFDPDFSIDRSLIALKSFCIFHYGAFWAFSNKNRKWEMWHEPQRQLSWCYWAPVRLS